MHTIKGYAWMSNATTFNMLVSPYSSSSTNASTSTNISMSTSSNNSTNMSTNTISGNSTNSFPGGDGVHAAMNPYLTNVELF